MNSRFVRISLDDLQQQHAQFDAAVSASAELDRFCSSSAWVIPAAKYLHPECLDTLIFRLPSGYCALLVIQTEGFGRLAIPLEASWGMGAPFVGQNSSAVLDQTFDALNAHSDCFDAIYTFGYPADGEWAEGIISRNRHHRLGWGTTSTRIVASLEGGMVGWLGRRTPRFRKNIRRLQRTVEEAGVQFEWANNDALDDSLQRIFAIESQSWKGLTGGGIVSPEFWKFYQMMLPMLANKDNLLVGFVTKDGNDLAYIFGGLHANGYRGLQMSFVESARHMGLGNFVQLKTIEKVVDRGHHRYDLGQDMAYKHAWGERSESSRALVIDKRGA